MTKTVLGLLRHGQTDWNIDFRLQGVSDIPLNQTGIEQARLAGSLIDASEWDLLITSPLSRAFDTATIVAEALGFDSVVTDELLLERSFGEAEGMLYEEWRERYRDTDLVPGVETAAALEERSHLLLASLAARYAGKRVLAVSHGALIRKLLEIASDGKFPRQGDRFQNASLSRLEHSAVFGWSVAHYAPYTLGTQH